MGSGELGLGEARIFCTAKNCAKPVKRAGLCYGHYMKQWRYGTPEPEHKSRYEDVSGRRFGTLVAISYNGNGNWLCECDCGSRVTRALSADLKRRKRPTCGNGMCRRDEVPSYAAVHQRLVNDLGQASRYECADCPAGARQWSYDHQDSEELHSLDEATLGIAYSADQGHYQPRCVPCHKRFDLSHQNGTHLAGAFSRE